MSIIKGTYLTSPVVEIRKRGRLIQIKIKEGKIKKTKMYLPLRTKQIQTFNIKLSIQERLYR